ncbi:response regulator [uncultured Thiodictyon sp.]|uniref:hybrid sensor histidine kinase/response regulator n=1 Tax=uncultured Thiodictyon sp. TaxID=1846217 RepID=UPI0025D49708|nr:response regulator [uncultured Thiodictyon sp.]
MIEDQELRDLFRAESAEHLQRIEAGLLQLERTPDDGPLLEEVFREAHSLKGAARMLGLREVQNLAHAIENLLGDARAGKLRISAALVPPQLATLDQIRRLVAHALGDEPAPPLPGAVAVAPAPDPPLIAPTLASLLADRVASAAVPIPLPQPAPTDLWSAATSSPAPASPLPDFRIDTLRIESTRLDALLQLGGELVVGKGRMARWQTELDQLLSRCEYHLREPQRGAQGLAAVTAELERLRGHMAGDSARLATVAVQIESGIRALRLLPMATLLDLFPRMVHDLSTELGKQLTYKVAGAATVADKRIIEELKAPLMHLLRNAIDHGIESPGERRQAGKPEAGLIAIVVTQSPDAVQITLSDDGRGLDLDAIRAQALKQRLHTPEELQDLTEAQLQALIFQPGFSTSRIITDLSGRGVGLDVVRDTVERLRGSLKIISKPGQGLTICLRLPVSLTATQAMLVREWGQTYAVAFEDIVFVTRLRPAQLHTLEGRQWFYRDHQAIPLERLGLLLDRAPPALKEDEWLHCLVLKVDNDTFGLALDEVLESEDIVVKPTTTPLVRVRNVSGLAVLTTGLVCPVLNPYDLLRSMTRSARNTAPAATAAAGEAAAAPAKRILLAEDSITTRMQERRILEAAGYEVVTAVDGLDAWNTLTLHPFDAVVSDIQMPRMSGLELAERIRRNRTFAELPIILITALASEEDRRRGMEVGADAYISKSEFDQSLLLDCLARLA